YLALARSICLTDQAERGGVLDGYVRFCSAVAAAPEGEPRSISISMLRGRRGDVLSNHVLVHYATGGLRASPSKGKRYGSAPVPVAPDPSDWPPLATVGEPIGTAMELNRALVVEAGSRLAGPPLLTSRDATGGIEAILEVTGPPRAVLRAYVEQLGTDTLDAHGVGDRVRIGDITHTGGTAAVSGGDYYQFTLIEQEGRPTLLHVLGGKD
ncbi:MAG: hypothetical protein JWM47_3872, partial [Acidimicrobiales bacterium]|nr:hypothetical protein [Acidimicrobiales bacterium]